MNTWNPQPEVQYGDVFYVYEDANAVGREMKKGRPAVIVSNDSCNEHSYTVTVAYMTGQVDKKRLPTHVFFPAYGKLSDGLIQCEHLDDVDKSRLGDRAGFLDKELIAQVKKACAVQLNITANDLMNTPLNAANKELQDQIKALQFELAAAMEVKDRACARRAELEIECNKVVVQRDVFRDLYMEELNSRKEKA